VKKVFHTPKQVSNIFESATKMFSGMAIQDILGKCWAVMPFQTGKCTNTPLKELDGLRVIDAKFEGHILIAVAEKDGKYNRYIFCFKNDMSRYSCRLEEDIHDTAVNFTVLSNGICVHLSDDDTIEIFKTNDKVKEVSNPPITTDMRLMNDSTGIIFINKNGLYNLKLK
jgi:hypothetical protein